jgi:hypothetical protein
MLHAGEGKAVASIHGNKVALVRTLEDMLCGTQRF